MTRAADRAAGPSTAEAPSSAYHAAMIGERCARDNGLLLRRRVFERLLKARPRAVLDVGCGRGELLRQCRSAGMAVAGVEVHPARVSELAAAGLRVVLGDGGALPFGDAAVPWVVVRHALHHMDDPRGALAEAVRVARHGLLIAEPWRPAGLPEQDLASELDAWTRRQERLAGHAHGEDVPVGRLVTWLDELGRFEIQVEQLLERARRPLHEVHAELDRCCAELPPEHPERHLLEHLLQRAEQVGVGATGSAIVVARLLD